MGNSTTLNQLVDGGTTQIRLLSNPHLQLTGGRDIPADENSSEHETIQKGVYTNAIDERQSQDFTLTYYWTIGEGNSTQGLEYRKPYYIFLHPFRTNPDMKMYLTGGRSMPKDEIGASDSPNSGVYVSNRITSYERDKMRWSYQWEIVKSMNNSNPDDSEFGPVLPGDEVYFRIKNPNGTYLYLCGGRGLPEDEKNTTTTPMSGVYTNPCTNKYEKDNAVRLYKFKLS